MFRVRIFTVDHYMSSPVPELDVTYSDFRKTSIKHVPVIRIFGTTPSGVKTCVHVHGIFPYICIPYDGSEPHLKLSYRLAASLDKAINIASGFSTSNVQHVYKIVLVSGIPFYGYHHKRHQFLKVYFYKPSVIKQAVNLLQNGAILNKVFQPHEAHIPFILQFFIDFNLYGMSFIDFELVKFRRTNFPELVSTIPIEHLLPESIRAVSTSQFEVDAAACHISNRPSSQGSGQICNPGIAAIWEDENRRRATREGSPVDIPHLHSQRPPQNSTSSELFHLDRIHRLLNNQSQSSDESSLSGEAATLTNKSYAIEEPPNTSALDASFVSLHVTETHSNVEIPAEVASAAMLEDTIVDEDLALMNSSFSQHLSQPLDKSLALDFEDLELLDVLETLADTRTAAVDDDSVLGSQTSKTVCHPSSSVHLHNEEANSDGEDEHWNDKTLVTEEDDALKLFDLTMPDIDENALLNELGPTSSGQNAQQIPQVDGNSDTLMKRPCKSRKKFQIPQVDGANDIPSKPGRKSLGMRGGKSRQQTTSKDTVLNDARYIPGTTDLIFQRRKKLDSASSVDPSQKNGSDLLGSYPSALRGMGSNNGTVNTQNGAFDLAKYSNLNPPILCEDHVIGGMETAGPSYMFSTQATIENTIQEQESLIYILPPSEEEAVQPCLGITSEELLQNVPLPDDLIVDNIQQDVAFCTSTADYSEDTEEIHCTDTFIDMIANKRKDAVLRGDPSFYPQAPLDKEDSFTELLLSGKDKFSDENHVKSQEPTSTSIRRSSRLSVSRECVTHPPILKAEASDATWDPTTVQSSANADELADPDGNMTPGTISDISVSGIAPLLTTTMFNDYVNDLGSSNTDASCSDSELCRLKDALDNDEMEEILMTGSEACIPESSSSRREELMRVIESSQSQSSNQKALEDPVTDELLRRGELPRKGPPKLGKNMALAQLYCGAPAKQKKRNSTGSSTTNKELKRVRREMRRLKLSVSAQRKKRNQSVNERAAASECLLKPCSVIVHKLTKKNIYNLCKKWNVTLEDKSALGIKSRKSLSTNLAKAKSPTCSQSTSLMLSARSRAITKSSVLSCGRTRRSFSKSELRKTSFKSEDFSQSESRCEFELPDISLSSIKAEPENVNLCSLTLESTSTRQKRKPVLLQTLKAETLSGSSAPTLEKNESSADHNPHLRANSIHLNNDTEFFETSELTNSQKATPQEYVAKPGSNPTSIRISFKSLLDFEEECGNGRSEETSSDDKDDVALVKRLKKRKLRMKKNEKHSSSKSEQSSCMIATKVIRTTVTTLSSGEKSVEISLNVADSDTDACSQNLDNVNTNLKDILNIYPAEKLQGQTNSSSASHHEEMKVSQEPEIIERREIKSFGKLSEKRVLSFSSYKERIDSKTKDITKEGSITKDIEGVMVPANQEADSKFLKNEKMSSISLKEGKIFHGQIRADKKSKTFRDSDELVKNGSVTPLVLPNSSSSSVDKSIIHSKLTTPNSGNGAEKVNKARLQSVLRKNLKEIHNKDQSFSSSSITPTKCAASAGIIPKQISSAKPVPLNSRRGSNASAKPVPLNSRRGSNASAKPVPIADIIPDVQCSTLLKNFKIPKKSEKDLKEDLPLVEAELNESTNDTLPLSLDTSSIDLELHALSDVENENVLLPTAQKSLSNPFKNSKILYVDGASTESSSDSSASGQGTGQEIMLPHPHLKRKMVEEDCEQKTKVQRDGNESGPNNGMPENSRELPHSVVHWFDKRYGPWTMWSPNISPVTNHLDFTRDMSPPQPFSPNTRPKPNFSGFAAKSHGCMGLEVEESNITYDNKLPSTLSSGQDLLMHLKSMESSGVEHGRNLKLQTETESSPYITHNSSGESSHSDMFSERSSHLHEDGIAEENKSFHDVSLNSSPSSNLSFSGSRIGFKKIICNEHKENKFSPEMSTVNVSGEQKKFDVGVSSLTASLERNELIHEDFILSCESSDIPCGQDTEKRGSQDRVEVKLSSDFKTLRKPPSRKDVLDSLPYLDVPEVVNQIPYFSNYHDVKGKVDVGSNVLELTSNNCLYLVEFQSTVDGLRGLSCQQKQLFARCWGLSQVKGNFNHLVSTHSNKRITVISPVIKPPKVKDVALWAKTREMALKAKKSDLEKEDVRKSSQNSELHTTLNESLVYAHSDPSQTDKDIQASTPQGSIKIRMRRKMPSPLLTPILTRSQSKAVSKSKIDLKNVSTCQSPLPSITEKEDDDIGASCLNSEVQIEDSKVPQDDSIRLDSQFCKDTLSPLFRHDSDASACQIKGVGGTPGYKMVLENLQSAKSRKEHQYITTLTMEVHICTCGVLKPDPERDPIRAIFYCVCNDVPTVINGTPPSVNGIIAVNSNTATPLLNRCGINGVLEYVADEKSLLQSLVSLVHKWDPDILAGFEIEMLSWGYVLQRASVLGVNIAQEFSRIPDQKQRKQHEELEDTNGFGGLKITGRIVLDAWRLFRSEVALQSYTFENLMYHILHKRVSHHSFESLSRWWEHPSHLHRWITVQYYQQRVSGIIRLLDQLDIVGRTSELARLFGIQFFEVLSRGSQFRVESMMLRLAKPLNFIPVSPSVQQRAHMRAPECLPLIMEPESRFYNDPMIVLDFQSLYPSMIIAYNYCFSTCLGRVEHFGKSNHFEFGCSELRVKKSHLRQLKDDISVSPSGIAFVTKKVRQGVLPRMLEEILEARLAVKQSMKLHKNDHTLQRVLHARQLGLKLIANVTYGYTSANFSGRMPCIEVGDSVVSKGRETLERAITLVHNNKEWRAKVVYGDTDSLFVLVPGRSRSEAFRIGAEIATAVTQDNPSPVKLKLEKVYQPCILQTKKRYVGFMYESPDQVQPVYEAKGIETVRRDGCPAVAKMLEKSLRILFETRDVSSVKNYVTHQFSKILSGRANIQDLIFAREYRGKENYRAGACVPALELTKRWLRIDRRSEPRIGERVPYVVTNGPPGSALIHLVRHPKELLSDPSLRYNAVYYVTRAIIPPLARCFSLLGADVLSWYSDLPRKCKLSMPDVNQAGFKRTISQYFSTMECACCGTLTHGGVCSKCQSNPQVLVTSLMSKLHSLELTHESITKICQSCLGRCAPLDCSSLDCPITYRRHQSSQKHKQRAFISQLLNDFGSPVSK